LSGTIPSELGQLEKLEGLVLSNNEFTGPLPSEVGNLQRLKEFAIGEIALKKFTLNETCLL